MIPTPRRSPSARRRPRWAVAVAVPVAVLLAAPAASAATFTGEVASPENAALPGGRDLLGASVSYDSAGRLIGTARLRAAPDPGDTATLLVLQGTVSGTSCVNPAASISAPLAGGAAQWEAPGGTTGPAVRGGGGTTLSLDSGPTPVPALADLGQRCFAALTLPAGASSSAQAFDAVAGPLRELAPTPPPPAPAPPAPAPPPTPAAPAPAPRLAVTVTGVPTTARRARWITARVRVQNVGGAPAGAVALGTTTARGLGRSWKGRRVGALAAGASRTVALRLRLTRRARSVTTLEVRATGSGGLRDAATVELRTAGAPSLTGGPGLVGRSFWGFRVRPDSAWNTTGVHFVNARYAYRGLARGGLPRCTRQTAARDARGQLQDGCVRWTLNRRTGALRVGDWTGTYRGGRLRLDEDIREELTVPRTGTRLRTALEHRGFRGLCGLVTGCTTYRYVLVLDRDGRFARSETSTSSLGGAGTSAPYSAISRFPADQHGTYQVLPRGRIRFSYADGTTKVQSIAMQRDAKGRADVVGAGVLLDDVNYYPEGD